VIAADQRNSTGIAPDAEDPAHHGLAKLTRPWRSIDETSAALERAAARYPRSYHARQVPEGCRMARTTRVQRSAWRWTRFLPQGFMCRAGSGELSVSVLLGKAIPAKVRASNGLRWLCPRRMGF